MVFTTPNTAGGTVTLGRLAKIPRHGEDLVITGIGPYGEGLRSRREPPACVPTTIYPFIGLDPDTLAPEWGEAVSIRAQFRASGTGETARSQQLNAGDGADMPETRVIAYLQEADTSTTYPHIRVSLWDLAHGLMLPDLYTIKMLPPPTVAIPGDPEAGIPATTTAATPVTLNPRKVDLREQIQLVDNQQIRRGDACIVVPRDGLEYGDLLANGLLFEVTIPGGAVIRYQLPGSEGIESLQTYDWKLYLNRLRP